MGSLKLLIINAVLRLRSPLFLRLYEWAYRRAIRTVVREISGIEGVAAIYLTGSSARDEVFHGLSDVDFKVFVAGPKNPSKHAEIQGRFGRLRRLHPMLGPADEKGIYFTGEFMKEWRHYPLVKHLFHEAHFRNRLIWGTDVLPGLPPPEGPDLMLSYTWRLGDWLEKLFTLYLRGSRLNDIQKRYLAFKAVCDAAGLCLRLRDGSYSYQGRERVLEDCLPGLDEVHRATGALLLREKDGFFLRGLASPGQVFSLFMRITEDCLGLMAPALGATDAGWSSISPGNWIGEGEPVSLPGAAAELGRLGIPVEAVLSLPESYVPVSPAGTLAAPDRIVVIIPRRPLTPDQMDSILSWRKTGPGSSPGPGEELVPELLYIRENPGSAYCLETDLTEYWLRTPLTDPVLFIRLASLEGSDPAIPGPAIEILRSRLLGNLGFAAELLVNKGAHRLNGFLFRDFISAALANIARLWILSEDRPTRLPGNCGVRSFFREELPGTEALLAGLTGPGGQGRGAGGQVPARLRRKLIWFLEALLEGVTEKGFDPCAARKALTRPDSPPEEELLKISVIVITRNRAGKLRRCLDSLIRQDRPADEVIIVDNGSSDDTRETAGRYRGMLPVRYVYEAEPGIPVARNAGISRARGDILSFIDDDAAADPAWLAGIEEAFLQDPDTGIVGGPINHLDTGREDLIAAYFSWVSEVNR